MPIQSRTRAQIRGDIGDGIGGVVTGTASANGSTVTIVDTLGLAIAGDDEFNNWNGVMVSGTAANIGVQFTVTDFVASSGTLTVSPALTSTVSGDGYELWHPPIKVATVNRIITQAEGAATKTVLIDKNDTTVFTLKNVQQYSIPTGFTHIDKVEYETNNTEEIVLHDCDSAWDELVDTDVAVAVDDVMAMDGSNAVKLTVAAAAGAGDILATDNIDSKDLQNCSHVEISVYSTVTLTAGYLQLILSATASGGSLTEALDIPATTAKTKTRHVIALANPQSDSAIISIGIKMVTDVGAFTLFVDKIKATQNNTRNFEPLIDSQWEIIHGSTDYLYLTDYGLSTAGTSTMLRIWGYAALTAMSADSSTSEIDPEYIIAFVSGKLMMAHALPQGMDTKARLEKAREFLNQASGLRVQASTSLRQGTRKI